jgi:beta-glucosidase
MAADVNHLLGALTLEEKTALLAGGDFWSTCAVQRLGIPSIRITDGPSGARGGALPGALGPPSCCVPCGSALGATWNAQLVEQVGQLVGREALQRGCRALLAPTVNLHRGPLAGRNFECYGEDPLLSGRLAAAFVRGAQSRGVVATVKHFVGNEQESNRMSVSSVIDQRALRELYLLPFEVAVKEGECLGVMCAYNRVNGRWVTQQPELLLDILRDEWGFAGLAMTDWFGPADAESAAWGLDLEMPGPGRVFGDRLADAVSDGGVNVAGIDAAVRRQLETWNRIGALDGPTAACNPAEPSSEDLDLMRVTAAEAVVLLHNDGVLPLDVPTLRRVAVIGPNAHASRIMGGGSSQVIAHPHLTPLEALRRALPPEVDVIYEAGCDIDLSPRPIGGPGLRSVGGFGIDFFAGLQTDGPSLFHQRVEELRIQLFGSAITDVLPSEWSMRAEGSIVADETGVFQLALAQNGRGRVLLNGVTVLDGVTEPPPPGGTDFWGGISQDLITEIELRAGEPAQILVEYSSVESTMPGVRVGFRRPTVDDPVGQAVMTAAAADLVILVVGTSPEWEGESRDRASFSLPGDQDTLTRRVAAANHRTVVVVNAGSSVDLPWVEDVGATLQCWFGGQEMAAAVADILIGAREPGGRLPITIPERIEHNPSFDNFPGENGEVRYGEGLFMGYRGYEHRRIEPRFPFGHGLGYTEFQLGEPMCADVYQPGSRLQVSVEVTNIGDRTGSEVIQCYVAPPATRLARPHQELKAFAKIRLAPGESRVVDLELGDRSFSYWDPGQPDRDLVESKLHPEGTSNVFGELAEGVSPGWRLDAGTYEIRIGRSSAELSHRRRVRVEEPGTGYEPSATTMRRGARHSAPPSPGDAMSDVVVETPSRS